MKLVYVLSAALICVLAGCASTSAGSVGAVFHTSSGQHITAATTPQFKDGRYEFVDAQGHKQALYLSQVTSVSRD
jgi:hypothetical protein